MAYTDIQTIDIKFIAFGQNIEDNAVQIWSIDRTGNEPKKYTEKLTVIELTALIHFYKCETWIELLEDVSVREVCEFIATGIYEKEDEKNLLNELNYILITEYKNSLPRKTTLSEWEQHAGNLDDLIEPIHSEAIQINEPQPLR